MPANDSSSHLPFRSFQPRLHVAVISFTGWVYNKVGTPDGDWIKTGKKAQDLPNDVNGNRVIETESGSVYRLVGPCLPGIKDWCKITNGPLRNQYVGSVCYKDGAEDYDEICTVYNSADPSHSTTTAATAQPPLLRRRTCFDAA